MPTSDTNSQQILLTHAVLTGLTPLIPVPLVDDLFYSYFLRSMVQKLAAENGKSLSSDEVQRLAAQPGGGCALGCLGSVLLYPLKKVLRKIFFFLEWKRATDLISHTYYQGYLLDAAFSQGFIETHGADAVRAAIDRVLIRTNTSPLTRAARGVVNQSKNLLQSLGQRLRGTLSGGQPDFDEIARAATDVAGDNERVGGLVSQLQSAIAKLPADHFQQLEQELIKELSFPKKN